MKIRTQYDVYEDQSEEAKYAFDFAGDEKENPFGKTVQTEKDRCDVNRIMRRFEQTGMVEHRNRYEGQYMDLTVIPDDFHGALEAIDKAREAFLELPAAVRNDFGNDPGEFLEFVSDPENVDEMREMGLLPPAEPKEAPQAPTEEGAKAPESQPSSEGDSKP